MGHGDIIIICNKLLVAMFRDCWLRVTKVCINETVLWLDKLLA